MRLLDLDITGSAPFVRTLDAGLLAMLGERPGAARTRIPDEDLRPSTPTPKPTPTKPKVVTPPSKPTPSTSTPTSSTDQARAGVKKNAPPPAPAAPPAPRPEPKPKPKAEPKPEPKPKPKADQPTPLVAPKGEKTDKPANSMPAVDDTPPRTGARPVRDPDAPAGARRPATDTSDSTPAPPDKSAIRAQEARYFANLEDGDDDATPTDATPTNTSDSTPAPPDKSAIRATEAAALARLNRDRDDESGPTDTSNDAPKPPDKAAIRRAEAEYFARDKAENLDDLTPAERQQLLDDQAELERTEREARNRNKPSEIPTGPNGRPLNRGLTEGIEQTNSDRTATANEEIQEARDEYFETHDVWIDANGTAYSAEVDEDGNIELSRRQDIPAEGNNPALNVHRTATIALDDSRTDVAVTRNEPTGEPDEVLRTRTETSHTNADGTPGTSSISEEQVQEHPNGSRDRTYVEENYSPEGVATDRVQEQEHTTSQGNVSRDRITTTFGDDGSTPTQTVSLHETEAAGTDATTSRETTTYFRADGTTPRRTTVVEGGTDLEGNALTETTAHTNFKPSGEPSTTYISRDGEHLGDTPASEYVVWGENGTVDRRITGGTTVSEYEYENFVATGEEPSQQDIPDEPSEPDYADFDQYDEDGSYEMVNEDGLTYYEALEAYESAHSEWEDDKGAIEEANRQNSLTELDDPESIPGHEDAVQWTRGGDDRWTENGLGGNLVEPLEPSTETPSVFDVPAEVRSRASADAIDRSAPATDPAAFNQLDQDQRAFEQQLDGATTDAQREQIMSEYFSDHPYWIDRGEGPNAEPVLMASAWSQGNPSYDSDLFGSSRALSPHATMARTGIQGQNDMEQPATIDVVRNLYTDGSQDDIVRTTHEGQAGASRTTVVGEHTNAGGVVTERDSHAESQVVRTTQGLPPLSVTEISRERFDEVSGKPDGDQYFAVAQSDHLTTSLEERTDTYGPDGIIDDTQIENTSMSRNYDADATEDFLDANAAAIEAASGGKDDYNPNDDEHESITLPPAGSNYVHSTTDIDYDAQGVAIHQVVEEESYAVEDSDADGGNGIRVTTTDTRRELGGANGTTPIFDESGAPAVDEDVTTSISTSEFDPDAGVAGGNKSEGHQYRQVTSITLGRTLHPDGTSSDAWATPLQTDTLNEGFDDDWVFERKYLKTDAQGQVQFNDDDQPIELGEGDEVYDRNGNRVVKEHDGYSTQDLDLSDEFEEFMEGWGGRIVGIAAIVAGIGGAVFTGGASLALTAVGVGLASASFAYTAINYNQGEASGWDLALSGAGVALAGLPAITGVKQLVNAGRAAASARAAGLTDDVVRSVSQNALRSSPALSRTTTNVVRTGNAADNAMDANDAFDATRAALQGDFWGAGMMLLAIGGGSGAVRVRNRFTSTPGAPAGGPDGAPSGAPTGTPPTGTPPTGTPPVNTPAGPNPGPATNQGAPTVRTPEGTGNQGGSGSTRIPASGTTTGAPRPQGITGGGADGTPDSSVGGARGDGLPDTPNTSPAPSGPAQGTTDGAGLIRSTPSALPTSPTPTVFADSVVADPRAVAIAPEALWGSEASYLRHVESHVGNYDPARMAAAGLEVPTTAAGNPIVDAASYHERALDYRQMAVTGRLEAGVTAHPRANGGMMLVNSRTNEVAFINADGSIGSLYPTYAVRTAADGTYRRNGNSSNRLDSFVQKELASDAQVYAIRSANANGDQAGLNQALEALREMNPNRYDAISRELGLTTDGTPNAPQSIFGRRNTVTQPSMPVAPAHLDRPFPNSQLPTSGNRLGAQTLARDPNVLAGVQVNLGDTIPWRIDGVSPDGTVSLSTARQRPFDLDDIARNNPDLVAQLGGVDALRWNPRLLEGHDIRTTRSNGAVEGGFRFTHDGTAPALVRTERSQSTLADLEARTGGIDLAGALARSQGPDLLAGRNRLQSAVESFPELLYGRPLRLLRGAHVQDNGQVVSPISDGWYAANPSRNQLGEATVDLQRNVRFDDLDAAAQQAAAAQGHGPGSIVLQTQRGIPVAEIVDFNRSRIEGRANSAMPQVSYHYGSLPGMNVEPGTQSGVIDPSMVTDPATRQRIEHLQANVEAIYDYMYSRIGWVPPAGMANFALQHGRIPDGNGGWTAASGPAHYPGHGFVIGEPGPADAAYDVGVLAHEVTHQYLSYGLGFEGGYRTQSGAFHEGFANYAAASFLRDPVIGRVFGLGVTHGHSSYDLNHGHEMGSGQLISTRGDWVAEMNRNASAAQARQGVEPHTGSGVISSPLTQISNVIGWNDAQRLAYDAISNPALNGQIDFGRFADSIRLTALDRYPVNSPEFEAIEAALSRAGITGWPRQGEVVSRITSRGEIEHGATFLQFQPDGRALLRRPNGEEVLVNQFGFLNDSALAHAFTAQRRVPSSGYRSPDHTVVAPVPPANAPAWPQVGATPAGNGSPWPAPNRQTHGIVADGATATSTATGSVTQPTLARRVADHLLLSPQAIAATIGGVSAQQVLDRNKREREQEQAALMAELERLGFIQAGITAAGN